MNKTKYVLVGYYYKNDYLNSEYHETDCKDIIDLYHPVILKNRLDEFVIDYYNPAWPILSFGTCHEDLFNIFGHYVADHKLSYNDITVVLYDENHNKIESYYDKNGYLINWPFGFFEWIG
jgi:hypothetical protein